MRKPQRQSALASLSAADREQLADWLRREHYDVVLERVNKPHPEGFGLAISKKPLQTFYAKVALFDLINSRLSDDKKLTLATFESLSSKTFNLEPPTCNTIGNDVAEKVARAHETILDATHDLATSGDNTPHQLLALQRLADFPARAAHREQMAALQIDRHEFAREKHAHKIALDLRKQAHKEEMDHFRKQIATERLNLSRLRLSLSAGSDLAPVDWPPTPNPLPAGTRQAHLDSRSEQLVSGYKLEAALGTHCASLSTVLASSPTSTSRDEMNDHGAAEAGPGLCSRRDAFTSQDPTHNPVGHDVRNMPSSTLRNTCPVEADRLPISISPCPLPPEVREHNALYSKKLRVGEVKHIFAPGELAHTQYCNPADRPYFAREEATGTATFVPDPDRTTYLRGLEVAGQESSLPKADSNHPAPSPNDDAPSLTTFGTQHSALSTQHSALSTQHSALRDSELRT
jgi:hypothetical protein